MDDRLKGLRRAMENSTFKPLLFSEQLRDSINKEIHKQQESEEEIIISVLQLLKQKKTGHELTQLLMARGVQKFIGEEGALYTLLHRLEHDGVIASSWNDTDEKYYLIKQKGVKLLNKAELSSSKKRVVLKELVQE